MYATPISLHHAFRGWVDTHTTLAGADCRAKIYVVGSNAGLHPSIVAVVFANKVLIPYL